MVPAASSSNWLKSRLFSGNPETSRLDRRSPPLAASLLLNRRSLDFEFSLGHGNSQGRMEVASRRNTQQLARRGCAALASHADRIVPRRQFPKAEFTLRIRAGCEVMIGAGFL